MSHFTKLKSKIVDLAYLKRALDDLDFNYDEGKVKIKGYLGQKMAVDLRIRTPEGYDIGFVKGESGYEVVADWDMIKSHSQQEFIAEVTRGYAYHVVKDQLQLDSFEMVEEKKVDNTVSLTMRRM